MSLSRAFTNSRRKLGLDADSAPSFMKRNHSTNKTPDNRPKISGPVELIHTTNILSYNAPDLPHISRSNTVSLRTGDSDTDTYRTAESTPPTSPDVSLTGRDCASPSTEPNHLSCYFQTAKQTTSPDLSAPPFPVRSTSHTKSAAYEALVHKRSVSRQSRDSDMSTSSKLGLTFSRSPSTSTRASSTSHSSNKFFEKTLPAVPAALPSTKEAHPFGQELAQVSELAEEYIASPELDSADKEDEQYLAARGLGKYNAQDYVGIVQSLAHSFFPEHYVTPAPLWI